jgi:hypothetical protein
MLDKVQEFTRFYTLESEMGRFSAAINACCSKAFQRDIGPLV